MYSTVHTYRTSIRIIRSHTHQIKSLKQDCSHAECSILLITIKLHVLCVKNLLPNEIIAQSLAHINLPHYRHSQSAFPTGIHNLIFRICVIVRYSRYTIFPHSPRYSKRFQSHYHSLITTPSI